MQIRPSTLAGQWYQADPQKLKTSIQKYLKTSESSNISGNIAAIVVPHAGHTWSGEVAAAAYKKVMRHAYERIFILCPNHRVPVHGVAGVSVDAFETPLGQVNVDRESTAALTADGTVHIDDAAHRFEHAIEIQLPFLQVVFESHMPSIIPLIVGDLSTQDAAHFADIMRKQLDGKTLILISSDFLHYGESYGYVPFGRPVQPQISLYDERTYHALESLNADTFEYYAEENPHAACGINALRVLMHIFQNTDAKMFKLAYDTSGRKSGDDETSVSYMALAVTLGNSQNASPKAPDDVKQPLPKDAQIIARKLVQRALADAVTQQAQTPLPDDFDYGNAADSFKKSYGVFVTLNEPNGNLRGCIGNILPVATLAESLWERAQDAALRDPRFEPVRPEELPRLRFEISILTKPTPIDSPAQIQIGKHGVVLKKGFRSAVFLPQVAVEQNWDRETMLTHLSLKAGLSPNAWQSGASFSVFEAQVF